MARYPDAYFRIGGQNCTRILGHMGIRNPNSKKDIKGWVLGIRNGGKLRNKGPRKMSGDLIQRGYAGLRPREMVNSTSRKLYNLIKLRRVFEA